jgi:uncharacterized lipoprotein YajG
VVDDSLQASSKGKQMKKFLPVVLATMALTSCSTQYSETPLAGNFATSTQNKLQASAHWLSIAKNVAEQIKLGTDKVGAPVYVMPPSQNSKFSQVFYEQNLIQFGNYYKQIACLLACLLYDSISYRICL